MSEEHQITLEENAVDNEVHIEETVAKVEQLDLQKAETIDEPDEQPVEIETQEVEEDEKEETTTKHDSPQEEEDEDDEDFGSFSDASFDGFEESPVNPVQLTTTITSSSTSKFPQTTFNNQDELLSKLQELTASAFPQKLPGLEIPSDTSILNERSEHLLERLTALPYLKPYNWTRSSLRKKLLQTLGLADDQILQNGHINQFDAAGYKVKKMKEYGITEEERKKFIEEGDSILDDILENLESVETLKVLDEESLKQVIKKLEQEALTVEKVLSCWEDQKSKLEEDNSTFESVVENLVGHTQRLRREETMKSLKKEKEKTNRLTGMFKLKKK